MIRFKKIISLAFVMIITAKANAQRPVPAPPQDKPIALVGGVAHLGNGQVIDQSVVAFDKGKLTIVADATVVKVDLSTHEVINIQGKHVYPGFILPNSTVGLVEVGSIAAMTDSKEHGEINPSVRSVVSYNTDSEYIPALRFNGILLAESAPIGGLISGTSSLMEMEGWNWEDAAHSVDIGIHMHWPSRTENEFDFVTSKIKEIPSKKYEEQIQQLTTLFNDAGSFETESSEANLKLTSMKGLFDGSKTLFIHAGKPKEIVESVLFAKKHGVQRITLITGLSCYHVKAFLLENKIPVLLPETHNLPDRTDDDVDLAYKLPFLLSKEGIDVSLYSSGIVSARNLGFFAGTAAAYGMSKEEALKTITLNTAKALGVDKRVGSLEIGKDATLFVSEGDALDYRSNVLLHAFISGKHILLSGTQQELFERYSKKYGMNK